MEQQWHGDRQRLPGADEDAWTQAQPAGRSGAPYKEAGVRRTRLASNWTAAALIVSVAAASGYFAHAAATPAASYGSGSTTPGTASVPGAVTGNGHKPSVGHSVVTSGGSGVVVGPSGSRTGSSSVVTWRDN